MGEQLCSNCLSGGKSPPETNYTRFDELEKTYVSVWTNRRHGLMKLAGAGSEWDRV